MKDRTRREFAVIGGTTVRRLIESDIQGCIGVVREAYLAHDAGQTINPQSVFLRFPERPAARIIGLPAHLRGASPVSGVKWISSFPENRAVGLPRASAVLILNEGDSGYPFACLEGSVISAARTAASAVLTADLILGGSRHIGALGVVGTGLIARHVVQFLLGSGHSLAAVYAYDTNPAALADFGAWVRRSSPDSEFSPLPGAVGVIAQSEVSLLATVASEPHVEDIRCLAHCPTVLHLSLRDLAPGLIVASNNVVDDPQHVLAAGTSIERAAAAIGHAEFITGTVADLLLGRRVLDRARPTIFSPFGLGMLDVAMGQWIYRRASEAGDTRFIEDFFVA